MKTDTEFLLQFCPNGCAGELCHTDLLVAEGYLRECPSCGQLVSSCSKQIYTASNQAWNTDEGTWPSENDMKKLVKRKTRDINVLSAILFKKKADIHLLDVGCSNGAFLTIAKGLELKAEGVEPSKKAAQNGRERGLTIHSGSLRQVALPEDSFDAITLYEVIEHVNEPIALLEECHRILKSGGVLLIGTGNVDSWTKLIRKSKWDFFDMNEHGGHISFFSLRSLAVLALRTGFRVQKVRTSSVTFYEKHEVSPIWYRITKVFSEALNVPARILNKGHQMEAYLLAE